MANKKHVGLSLNDKVKVIEAREREKMSVNQIMLLFKCGKTQIYEAIKNKEKIMSEWMKGNGNMKRKLKMTGNEEINELLYEWFVCARAKNMPINGPILIAQALELAKKLNRPEFKASSGWLDCFKNRHGIVWNQICGEANDVNEVTVDEWKKKLSSIVQGFEPKNIFNGDETGLFFRALPSKTFAQKGEKCIGGKMSKERLTVFLCSNMIGDMEKPVVIGKAAKPRAFKNLNITKLPVIWRSNKKSWMTGALMEEWLNSFNGQMKRQKRHVILFLDNAACHPHINLSNVKLAWFPPNTTSITQPMDQGVIYNMKVHYRRLVLQSLIVNIEKSKNSSDLVKSISVLDAVNWISIACKNIKKETIGKCFHKAGFAHNGDISSFDDTETTLQTITQLCDQANLPNDAIAYVMIDNNLAVEHTFQSACELLEQRQAEQQEENEEEEEATDDEKKEPAIKTHMEAIERVSDLLEFATESNLSEVMELLYNVKDCFEKSCLLKSKKQTTLLEMWEPRNK